MGLKKRPPHTDTLNSDKMVCSLYGSVLRLSLAIQLIPERGNTQTLTTLGLFLQVENAWLWAVVLVQFYFVPGRDTKPLAYDLS